MGAEAVRLRARALRILCKMYGIRSSSITSKPSDHTRSLRLDRDLRFTRGRECLDL
jgi:hypothetical protein